MIFKSIKKGYIFTRLLGLIARLEKKPQDTIRVFAIVDFLIERYDTELLKKAEDSLAKKSLFMELKKAYSTNTEQMNSSFDIQKLSKLPQNTFGYNFSQYMIHNNLDQEFFLPKNELNNIWLVRNRLAKTHDIFHFLTGFGFSDFEEYGLQAFYLGQEPSMAAYCIMLAGFWSALKKMRGAVILDLMNNVTEGYTMGKTAKNIIYVIWEDLWEIDLDELRNEYCVTGRGFKVLI
jgi:ubiquinone biosynthesis protein Coq4